MSVYLVFPILCLATYHPVFHKFFLSIFPSFAQFSLATPPSVLWSWLPSLVPASPCPSLPSPARPCCPAPDLSPSAGRLDYSLCICMSFYVCLSYLLTFLSLIHLFASIFIYLSFYVSPLFLSISHHYLPPCFSYMPTYAILFANISYQSHLLFTFLSLIFVLLSLT